jgi:hypothetical protein
LPHGLVQWEIRYHALKPRILLLPLLSLPRLRGLKPRVLLLPSVNRLFGNTNSPGDLGRRNPGFGLFQNRCNLLHGKALSHRQTFPYARYKFAAKLAMTVDQKSQGLSRDMRLSKYAVKRGINNGL